MRKSVRIMSLMCCILCIATSRPVQAAAATNLVSTYEPTECFARTWGMVRYFSPNPYTQQWSEEDWFSVCYYLLERLHESDEPDEILKLFTTLAPNASFSDSPDDRQLNIIGHESDYSYRRHHGGGKLLKSFLAGILSKKLRNYNPFYSELVVCDGSPNTPQAGVAYAFPAAENLYLLLPVAERNEVFSKKDTDDLLKAAKKSWKRTLKSYSRGINVHERSWGLVNNVTFRTADIMTRWNHVRHFYPYLADDTQDWDAQLSVMLERMRTFSTSSNNSLHKTMFQYHRTIRELLKPVCDTHLTLYRNVYITPPINYYISYTYLPIQLDLIENNIIVRAVSPKCQTDLVPGSIIETVNGSDAFSLLEQQLEHISLTNRETALRFALRDIISSPDENTEITLGYRTPDGTSARTTLSTFSDQYIDDSTIEGPFLRFTEDNIAIIDPCQRKASYKDFADNIDKIRAARGIVFNLRGYPMYDFDKILAHLTDEPISVPFISTPIYCFPNQKYMTLKNSTEVLEEVLEPASPKIDVPVVFLCNHMAVSWAETVLMLVDGYDLGTIVGTPSCGTNGDITYYMMPVFDYIMTANHATNADGSRHHGIGVVPDIEAAATFEGYLAGRDEVLDAGLQYLRNLNI